MLTTLVLTRSYAGNLMSLLAVRYVPQPFQTPRDVVDHPSVVMIWEKHSKSEQFLRVCETGKNVETKKLMLFLLSNDVHHINKCNHDIFFSFFQDVESGMFKEVAELEQKGRLEFHTQSQFLESLSSLVRIGHHVLVIGDITIRSLVASYVSHTGKSSLLNIFFFKYIDLFETFMCCWSS